MSEITSAELVSAYKSCFGTDSGRIVLKHLMKAHGVLLSDFVEENTHATAFNQGGRHAVLGILKKLHLNEDKLQESMIEQGEDYAYDGEAIL